ncbi:DUF2993 domain-containing protein [Pseudonocardia sp.]|uniref:LmeA family phospholipid-binding protein n=1 Tax=Pseudonocardia sp. TaxID=60912 RepID=UPI0031FDD893
MKRLIVVLLVLVGVLVAVDYGAAAAAESAVSRQMRERLGLADDPSVRINGFPFLAQALSGEYRSVQVEAQRVPVGQLRQVDVRAQLNDVTAPLSELLGSGPKTLRVANADGSVRVGTTDLEALLPGVQKLTIANLDANALDSLVRDGGADPSLRGLDPETTARFGGTVAALGQELDVAVVAELQIVDGKMRIVPRDVRLGDTDADPLPAPVQSLIQQLFTVQVDPGTLPFEVTPTKFRARDGELELLGSAQNLLLGAGGAVTTG